MNFQKVIETELKIRADGMNGAFTIKPPALLDIKGEDSLKMPVSWVSHAHKKDYFFIETFPKSQIMLHFTEGHLRGDLASMTAPNADRDPNRRSVSVPFVVARDGTIYQIFPVDAWAFHIGKPDVGNISGREMSQRSIAIEISNYGPLDVSDNNLNTQYGDVYCSLDHTSEYVKLDKPYRGKQYFAAFTDAQYDATIVLLRYLTAEFGIPRAFLEESIRVDLTDQAANFNGIVTHVNVRQHKIDVGPSFDWARVIEGVTAPSFTPTALQINTGTRGLDDLDNMMIYVGTAQALYEGEAFEGTPRFFNIEDDEPDF